MKKVDVFHALVAGLIVLALWANGFIRADARDSEKYEYTAVVRCDVPLAEDTAGHIRLVRYGDGKLTYRCVHRGY